MTHTPVSSYSQRAVALGRRGFTLIEILVVIVVIAILASVVAPSIMGNVDDARVNTAKNQMKVFEAALNNYRLHTGVFPATDQGLEALVEIPGINPPRNWRGPYLDGNLPLDPWGAPYIYVFPGEFNPRSYDLYSYGADGQPGGEGINADISNWE